MEIQSILEYITINYGYLGGFVLTFLEYSNFPLPSEIVLPLIGVICSNYELNLIVMIFVSSLAGVFGSILNYSLGYKIGNYLLQVLCDKFKFLTRSINYTKDFIKKHGKRAVFTARIIPLARTAISLVAGVYKIPIINFTLYSFAGILIWNTILISMGYILKDNFGLICAILSKYSIICLIMLIIFFIIKYSCKRK